MIYVFETIDDYRSDRVRSRQNYRWRNFRSGHQKPKPALKVSAKSTSVYTKQTKFVTFSF